jgi:N-acyl-D-aspartate/D-glutamate deacylase
MESFAKGIPWDWATYPEYRSRISDLALTLSINDLVGHSLLRLWVIGPAAWERPSTDDEIREMVDVLEAALLAGASGLSSSIFDRDAEGRPVPSALSDDRELKALIELLGCHGKLLEFIPEVRTDQWLDDVLRFAKLCGPHQVPLSYNGISCDTARPGWFAKALHQAPELSEWVGRSLADLSAARRGHPSDVLADRLLENDLGPGVMSKAIRNDHVDEVAHAITHPLSLVSNSDAGGH